MDRAAPPRLIDVLSDPSSPDLDAVLGDDVRFRSPFTDYAGRADVGHLFGLIREVLVDVRPARRLEDDATTMSLFEARVPDADVQGVLYEQRDDAGLLVDSMLTIRPYAGLRAAMRAMEERMRSSPLPSAR